MAPRIPSLISPINPAGAAAAAAASAPVAAAAETDKSPRTTGMLVHSPSRRLADKEKELLKEFTPLLRGSRNLFGEELEANPNLANPKRRDVLVEVLASRADKMLALVNGYMKFSKALYQELGRAAVEVKGAEEHPREAAKVVKFRPGELVHDFRNPLSTILNCLRTCKDPSFMIETLTGCYDTLDELNGGSQKQKFTMGELKLRVMGLTSQRKQGVQVVVELKNLDEHCGFKGDLTKIVQILNNLICNALTFTDTGGKVEVDIEKVKVEDKTKYRFSVKDKGPGIPPAVQVNLFRPYTQGDQSQRDSASETSGQGLYISATLCTLLDGGPIQFVTEAGKGTTFYFDLPLRPLPKERPSSGFVDSPKTPKYSKAVPPNTQLLILYAEDNRQSRTILGNLVTNYEKDDLFSVNLLDSGPAAVEAFNKAYYEVVILDMRMPNPGEKRDDEEAGWKAARKIFEMARERKLPFPHVIICSGNDESDLDDLKKKAVEANDPFAAQLGKIEFASKNGRANELLQRVVEIGNDRISKARIRQPSSP